MTPYQFQPENLTNPVTIELSQQLRFLRRKNGLRQRHVAEALHIDRSTYAAYETGKSWPNMVTLIHMAQIFNVSIDFLLGYHPDSREVIRRAI